MAIGVACPYKFFPKLARNFSFFVSHSSCNRRISEAQLLLERFDLIEFCREVCALPISPFRKSSFSAILALIFRIDLGELFLLFLGEGERRRRFLKAFHRQFVR